MKKVVSPQKPSKEVALQSLIKMLDENPEFERAAIAWLRSHRLRFNPSKLELVVSFSEQWPRVFNTLFADAKENLFFANSESDGSTILRDGEEVELKDAIESDFHPVSLEDALEWYGRYSELSTCGCGYPALICEMASRRLR